MSNGIESVIGTAKYKMVIKMLVVKMNVIPDVEHEAAKIS